MGSNTSVPSRDFSKRPVLVHTDADGFEHHFYVMYHATGASRVESILDKGFHESAGGMLGPGFYVSRDIEKTRFYATRDEPSGACFKLLAYAGKTKMVKTEAEMQKCKEGSWGSEYDSIYLPPNNDVVDSKREETCLRDGLTRKNCCSFGFRPNEGGGGCPNFLASFHKCIFSH